MVVDVIVVSDNLQSNSTYIYTDLRITRRLGMSAHIRWPEYTCALASYTICNSATPQPMQR